MEHEIQRDKLYSTSEVATFIGKHARTVRRYVRAGKFPNHLEVGPWGHYYIPGSDVIAFLEQETQHEE